MHLIYTIYYMFNCWVTCWNIFPIPDFGDFCWRRVIGFAKRLVHSSAHFRKFQKKIKFFKCIKSHSKEKRKKIIFCLKHEITSFATRFRSVGIEYEKVTRIIVMSFNLAGVHPKTTQLIPPPTNFRMIGRTVHLWTRQLARAITYPKCGISSGNR